MLSSSHVRRSLVVRAHKGLALASNVFASVWIGARIDAPGRPGVIRPGTPIKRVGSVTNSTLDQLGLNIGSKQGGSALTDEEFRFVLGTSSFHRYINLNLITALWRAN